MYFVGIDPGVKGAISIISTTLTNSTLECIHDMPVVNRPTAAGDTRNRIDVMALSRILSCFPSITGIIIEDVHSRPGEGATNAFSFGHGLRTLEAVTRLTGAPVTMVTPALWKKAFGLTADKNESRYLAEKLSGDTVSFSRAKDDGRAEAYLLALYVAANGAVDHQGAILDEYRAAHPSVEKKPRKARTTTSVAVSEAVSDNE